MAEKHFDIMARVVKKFNTEAEYEEWVNGPWMRTPYTCLVKETGAVHYFEGDDDDCTVKIVVKKTGWMQMFSYGAAPKFFSTPEQLVPRSTDIRKICLNETIVYDNEHLIGDEIISGRYVSGKRGANPHTTHNGLKKLSSRGYTLCGRRYIYAEEGDVITIYFQGDKIPPRCFYGCGENVSEYIVGDGFRFIQRNAFDNRDCEIKIYLGKNIKKVSTEAFRIGGGVVRFSPVRKRRKINTPSTSKKLKTYGNAKVIYNGHAIYGTTQPPRHYNDWINRINH